jgi:uncharacterized protein (TIGR02453 family)
MVFNGFSKKGISFLKDLEQNNTKIWFENNRHIWEDEIRKVNENFVEDMGETLQILDPNINFNPKVGKSLFKIYRDVRFSKDKTPLKSKIGIIFYGGNKHRMQSSSFYMHYTKDSYFIATGIRNFKPELLKHYREYIKDERKRIELYNILNDLKNKGYNLPDKKYKNIPKTLSEYKDDKYIDLSLYGAIFAYKEFTIDNDFYTINILDKAFSIYEDMQKLYRWLYEMTQNQ